MKVTKKEIEERRADVRSWQVRTVEFDQHLPDSQIAVAVYGNQNVVEIRRPRKGKGFRLKAYTYMTEDELLRRLTERVLIYRERLYAAMRKNATAARERYLKVLSRNAPCQVVTQVDNGRTIDGRRYLDDDGVWKLVFFTD